MHDKKKLERLHGLKSFLEGLQAGGVNIPDEYMKALDEAISDEYWKDFAPR